MLQQNPRVGKLHSIDQELLWFLWDIPHENGSSVHAECLDSSKNTTKTVDNIQTIQDGFPEKHDLFYFL